MVINSRVNEMSSELIKNFLEVDPATIGHFLNDGFVDYGINPLWSPVKFAGPAFTVRTSAMDTTMLHRCYEMLEPGDVLIIDRSGDMTHAGFGGYTAFGAKTKGVAGVVVDGLATDIQEIKKYELPVFARGLTTLTTKMWGTGGDINVPVSIGGVIVHPGDLVVADDNGILILSPEDAPELLKMAIEAEEDERKDREKMKRGVCLTELTNTKNLLKTDIQSLIKGIRKGDK